MIEVSLFLLLGNKSDSLDKRQVLFEDACTLAEKHGLLAVLETSAKEAQNIEEVFTLMAKELIARNTLQLHGENLPNSFSLDSRPVIASPSVEKTQCSCWRETSGRAWRLPLFWGCLIQFCSVDERVLCGLKPSLLLFLPCSLACEYFQRSLLLLVAQVALNIAMWTSQMRGLRKLRARALTKENYKIIAFNYFLTCLSGCVRRQICTRVLHWPFCVAGFKYKHFPLCQ